MASCGISFLGALLLVLIAQPATAQIGAFSRSPDREVGNNSRSLGAQVECGPIGCRPLPSGCKQVRLGGRWLDNNGLRVVCDPKRN
ncbi:MAG TPA: hypothetical protein VF077_02605 [Nitrospiraceae bacterium]